jgi:hypothetical protein
MNHTNNKILWSNYNYVAGEVYDDTLVVTCTTHWVLMIQYYTMQKYDRKIRVDFPGYPHWPVITGRLVVPVTEPYTKYLEGEREVMRYAKEIGCKFVEFRGMK